MNRVRRDLSALAALPWHVRIEGPSGTGKGVAARFLHALSRRARAAFVLCSLAGLSDDTATAELTGWRAGSFTSATEDREGKFEAAHGGTLFLDEIATATREAQLALLQLVDTGIVQRKGEVRERHVDVRCVFATNENLSAAVRAGSFRADLYYRMGELVVQMPSLAERREDIPLLLEQLLLMKAQQAGRPVPQLGICDLERLQAYDWPGNVRELALVAEVIVAFGELPDRIARLPVNTNWRSRVADTVAQCGGNKTRAARLLGISRTALHSALGATPRASRPA